MNSASMINMYVSMVISIVCVVMRFFKYIVLCAIVNSCDILKDLIELAVLLYLVFLRTPYFKDCVTLSARNRVR